MHVLFLFCVILTGDPIVAMSTFTDKSKLLMVGVAQEHNDTKQK